MPSFTDPSVHSLMLVLSLACFGLWIATYRMQAATWRFELYAIDFALGAFLFASLAALTFGNAGTDLPFSDRLIVSSKTSQTLAVIAGCMFGVGNALLLGSVSLLGVGCAYGISGGVALAVGLAVTYSSSGSYAPVIAAILCLAGAVLAAVACRSTDPVTAPPAVRGSAPAPLRLRRSARGILVATLGGLAMAFSYPLALRGVFDDFGLGPYAGLFIFSAGVLAINLLFSLYFFNIALDGGAIPLKTYLRHWPQKHVLGIIGGAIWGLGALTFLLQRDPATVNLRHSSAYLPLGSISLAMLLGLLVWPNSHPEAKTRPALLPLALSLLAITGAIAMLAFG